MGPRDESDREVVRKALLMGLDAALEDAVGRALAAQSTEYETDFEATNEPLQWLIDQVGPDDQLEIGHRLLEGEGARERVLGARLLRETWDRRVGALDLVVGALQRETDDEVLGWLLAAVAFLGDSSALDAVMTFAHHPDTRVRDQVAGAISRCGADERSSSALAALIELADDPEGEVRFSALFELGQWWQDGFTDARVQRRLRRALGEGESRIRDIAAEAFAAVPPPE